MKMIKQYIYIYICIYIYIYTHIVLYIILYYIYIYIYYIYIYTMYVWKDQFSLTHPLTLGVLSHGAGAICLRGLHPNHHPLATLQKDRTVCKFLLNIRHIKSDMWILRIHYNMFLFFYGALCLSFFLPGVTKCDLNMFGSCMVNK